MYRFFCGQNNMQMNYLIVEKKFISSCSSQKLHTFRQIKDKMLSMPSYSTIFYDRENTQSMQSQLKNTCSKPSFQLGSNNNNFNKNEGDSDALTYSRTGSLLVVQDFVPLLKKIVALLSSRENIASHVSHSLGVRGYKSELSTEMGKIIANSFGEYISIAQSLGSKLVKEDSSDKDDRIMGLNREIAALKMENAKLFEKTTRVQQQNHKLKKKISGMKEPSNVQSMGQNNREQLLSNFQKDVSGVMSRMNSFEAQVYRKLGTFQHTLIEISSFRNNMAMNIANGSRWREECDRYKQRNTQLQRMLQLKQSTIQRYVLKENTSRNRPEEKGVESFKKLAQDQTQQIQKLQNEISHITQQLVQQKKLYNQMLDKNISLQKQLYFLSLKPGQEDPSDSLHIEDSPGQIGSFCDSGIGSHCSPRLCGGVGVCGSGGVM